ncbi:MAG TPA: hypothetical protein VF116_22025 [Ktedonobacterales bacterium]
MRLPYLQNAQVTESKVVDYLLSEDHSEGKAAFFGAFGFTLEHWQILRDALLAHAASHEIIREVVASPYGTKYVIEGTLPTPVGRNPAVRSVWIVDAGTEIPRLVTAYALH